MKRVVFYVMFLASGFSLASVASSDTSGVTDRYQLIKGAGIEVCEAYGRNLNMTMGYPACNRKIVLPAFARPEWKQADALANIRLVTEIDDFLQGGRKPVNEEFYLEHLKRRVKDGSIRLDTTNMDIDNDSHLETVVRYEVGRCLQRFRAAPLLVLNAQANSVDISKTELLLQNKARTKEYTPGRWGYAMYQVFLYEGRSYFDRWSDDVKEKGYLRVFGVRGSVTREICVYKYD